MSLPVPGHKSSWCDRHARARHASLQYLLARAAVGNDTTRTARAGRRRTVRRTARRKERCRHASPACDDGRLVSRLAPSMVARPNSKCTMFAAQESGRRLSGAIEEERVRVILVARQPAARPLFRCEIFAPKGLPRRSPRPPCGTLHTHLRASHSSGRSPWASPPAHHIGIGTRPPKAYLRHDAPTAQSLWRTRPN